MSFSLAHPMLLGPEERDTEVDGSTYQLTISRGATSVAGATFVPSGQGKAQGGESGAKQSEVLPHHLHLTSARSVVLNIFSLKVASINFLNSDSSAVILNHSTAKFRRVVESA